MVDSAVNKGLKNLGSPTTWRPANRLSDPADPVDPGAQAAMDAARQRSQAAATQASTQAQNAAGYPTTQPATTLGQAAAQGSEQAPASDTEDVASTSNPLLGKFLDTALPILGGGIATVFGGPGAGLATYGLMNAGIKGIDSLTSDSGGGGSAAGAYAPDPSNFVDPYQAANQGLLASNYSSYQNRTAPIGTGATIGSAATVNAAQIGAPTTYDAATGNAAQSENANINRSDLDYRNGQNQSINNLYQQSIGQGPSLATDQMRLAQERALAQQVGAAASARGPMNPALQQKQLATNAVQSNQAIGTAAAQQRIQEQLNAQQQLTGALGNARAQDIGVNTSQAGFDQQTGLANANLNQNMTLANLNAVNSAYNTNAGAYNTNANNQANLNQNANLSNQNAYNTNAYQQAGLSQDMTKYNLADIMANQGQNDAMVQNATNGLTNQSQQAVDNAIKYEDLKRAGIQGNAATAESARQFDQTTQNQAISNGLTAFTSLYNAYNAANPSTTGQATGTQSGQSAYDASKGVSDRKAKKHIVPAKEALMKSLTKNLYKGNK